LKAQLKLQVTKAS